MYSKLCKLSIMSLAEKKLSEICNIRHLIINSSNVHVARLYVGLNISPAQRNGKTLSSAKTMIKYIVPRPCETFTAKKFIATNGTGFSVLLKPYSHGEHHASCHVFNNVGTNTASTLLLSRQTSTISRRTSIAKSSDEIIYRQITNIFISPTHVCVCVCVERRGWAADAATSEAAE